MRNFATTCTLVFSVPDGMTDQQAFTELNKSVNPYGIDFVFPLRPQFENPVIMVRILKTEPPKV